MSGANHPTPDPRYISVEEKNTGHGHVFPRPDGVRARCGGPGLCAECSLDLSRKINGEPRQPESHLASNESAPRPQQHSGISLADFYADLAHWCGLDWPKYSMHEAAHEAVEALADAKEEIERLTRERDEAKAEASTWLDHSEMAERERDRLQAALVDARATFRRINGEILEDKYQYRRWAEECLRRIGVAGSAPETSAEFEGCHFVGGPPLPFTDWNSWAASAPRRGVTIRASEKANDDPGCRACGRKGGLHHDMCPIQPL